MGYWLEGELVAIQWYRNLSQVRVLTNVVHAVEKGPLRTERAHQYNGGSTVTEPYVGSCAGKARTSHLCRCPMCDLSIN